MQTIQDLLSVLEISAKKHGADHPVTIGHLVNILKMVEAKEIKRYEQADLNHKDCLEFAMGEHGQG